MSKQIYEKVSNGDSISDSELKEAVSDYLAAEKALLKLGLAFAITRKAVTMTLIHLQDIQQARKENK